MVVIHLRSGRDVKVPKAQGVILRKGKLICLDDDGRAMQSLKLADVDSFNTTPDPPEEASSSSRKGGLNLLGRLHIKKAHSGLPPDRVDRLKERVRLQSEALAGDAALEFMEEDNREMRLEEWAKPAPVLQNGTVADAATDAGAKAAETENRRPAREEDMEYLVSLLQDERERRGTADARDS